MLPEPQTAAGRLLYAVFTAKAVVSCLQAVRKLHGHLKAAKQAAVERTLPQVKPVELAPHEQGLDEELDEAAKVLRYFEDLSPYLRCVACMICLSKSCASGCLVPELQCCILLFDVGQGLP